MHLTPFVDTLRQQLAVAAEAGGEEARVLAERLTASLESATRLVLLEALSAAADEITRELAPGTVEVRLRGQDPSFVVTPPPGDEMFDDLSTGYEPGGVTVFPGGGSAQDAEGGTARLNLRLPDTLKSRIEEAARSEGLSLNAWLVRVAAAAVELDSDRRHWQRREPWGGQSYTGWVR
jgi:hypothetical protein